MRSIAGSTTVFPASACGGRASSGGYAHDRCGIAVRRIEAWLPRLLPGAHLSPNGDQKRVPALVAADKRQMRGDVCLGLLALDAVRESRTPFQRAHVLTELRWCKRH